MILVTGGAGFIGSSLVKSLNEAGFNDIIICDNLKVGMKMLNLVDLKFSKYVDKHNLWSFLDSSPKIETIFHLGACSATTEWDGKYLYENNFEFSRRLLDFAEDNGSRFIYASSASVYGTGQRGFTENEKCERPINAYAASKLLFDNYVRSVSSTLSINPVGLRYFNVYGEREAHKAGMKSTIHIFSSQFHENGSCKLFGASAGFTEGEQKRDFVYVKDCVDLNLWLSKQPQIGGIFNVGTGQARTFNEVAKIIRSWFVKKSQAKLDIEYIDFPKELEKSYQYYTQADLSHLQQLAPPINFTKIEDGIPRVLNEIYRN